MIKSKVVDLLKSLSKDEFKNLGLYIDSPLFNREIVHRKFYDILKKYYPDFENKKFTKEFVFKQLYPEKKYNDGMMRNILSTMLTQVQNFLSVKNFLENDFSRSIALMNELTERNQQVLFKKEKNSLTHSIDNQEIKNFDHYYSKFLLEGTISTFNEKQTSKLAIEQNLLKAREYLNTAFMISLLKLNTQVANTSKNFFDYHYDDSLMKSIENFVANDSELYKNNLYVRYYYNSLQLAKTGHKNFFYELKEIINKNFDLLGYADKKDIYTVLTNYCYTRVNKGETEFVREQFLLFKESIERGFYKGEKKYINHTFFMSVVVCGLESGEFGWIEDFITNYKNELDEDNRENTFVFCSALVHYWKKEFDKALQVAAEVRTNELSYKHQLKSLYLKIYFDLNETEQFYSHIDSYRHFITKDKNIPKQSSLFLNNYINFSKRLFDLKNNTQTDDEDYKVLRDEIINNEAMINKSWLLKKICEFIEES